MPERSSGPGGGLERGTHRLPGSVKLCLALLIFAAGCRSTTSWAGHPSLQYPIHCNESLIQLYTETGRVMGFETIYDIISGRVAEFKGTDSRTFHVRFVLGHESPLPYVTVIEPFTLENLKKSGIRVERGDFAVVILEGFGRTWGQGGEPDDQ